MTENTPTPPLSFKPGFMARLGFLIVSQVVFLFLALALILFVPGTPSRKGPAVADLSRLIDSVSDALISIDSSTNHAGVRPAITTSLEQLLKGNSVVSSLSVIGTSEMGEKLSGSKAYKTPESVHFGPMASDSAQVATLVRLVGAMPCGYQLNLTEQNLVPLHFRRIDLPNSGPVVVVVEGFSDLIASRRSELIYAIGLLFLSATLVSLLTVYLLWKRFKTPLEKLTRQIEATAARPGERFQKPSVDEEELSRLATGFNRLSDSLERDHSAAHEAGKKLHLADEALRESQKFLHTIIENSPAGLFVTDAADKILLLNAAAVREFNCPAEEAVGQHIGRFFSLPNGATEPTPDQSGFETVCWKRDAEAFPAYIVTAPVETEDGVIRARLYIVRDIVESRGYQDMMVRLDRNSTRGAMAADIGHEINNFLAVVLGNIELLPRSIAKGDEPGIRKKLDTVKANVEKIARFADGLMVESPNEDVICTAASVNQIVENVIAFLRYQNRFDGVDWVVQLHPDLPMAEVDETRIQQVLVNLLYNAGEAVGEIEGNRVITVVTGIADRNGMPVVRVDVQDNGRGVQGAKEPLLFKSRFTTKKKGHGFGLMTCQRIIDQHGGRIAYAYHDGAHFWIELPLVHAAPAVKPETAAVTATV